MFDPYEKWLGIAADQRPVDFYQLLDIDPEDADSEAIEEAAERQAARVRRHQQGAHAEVCARVLKEIEQAEATLRSPAKRKQYDAQMRKASAGKHARDTEDSEETAEKVTRTPRRDVPQRDGARDNPARSKKGSKDVAKGGGRVWLLLGLGGAAVLLLVVGAVGALAIWYFSRPGPTSPVTPVAIAPPSNPIPAPVPPPEKKPDPPKPAPEPPKPAPEPKLPVVVPPVVPVVKPPAPEPAPKVAKFPVPSAEEQAAAEKDLRVLYKADYAKPDKLVFAGKLLQPGRENRQNPATWYVLLREARDLAVQGNGPRLAAEAIQEMDQFFIIDAAAMKIKALTTIAQAPGAPAAFAVAETSLGLANRAVDEDNYESAGKLIATAEMALGLVPKNKKQPKLVEKHLKLAETRKSQLEGFIREHQSYQAAREKLRQTPDASDANLAIGKFLCFFHGKWDEGLPYLAKGSDNLIKAVAKQDLAKPEKVDRQMILANDWWDQARVQQDRYALNVRRRAKFWYERAGQIGGPVERATAAVRIKEADDAEAARLVRLLPGSYYGRGVEDRVLLLREGGGTMRSEQAVERGLEWLRLHQAPSGQWSNDAFGAFCNCGNPGHKFDVAGTAFGLLPFLGAGHTHKTGPHAKTIYKGLGFLLANQKKEGNFSDNMYENALATIVVCEAYGMTRDTQMQAAAQAAVAFIVRAQHSEGGWGYSPGAKGDTSITGWQFTALKAGAYAGLPAPRQTFDQLGRFLDTMEDPAGLGYGYNTPGAGRATSAVGLLCREFLGWGPANPRLAKGVNQLFQPANFPSKNNLSIYFIFYATQMIHHAGGKNWEAWNPKVRDLLIELQDQGLELSHQDGSWSPLGDDFAAQGGRLMFTSLALITLEVYYYHIPLYSHGPAVLLD